MEEDWSLISSAIANRDIARVTWLLDEGADPNVEDADGESVLALAICLLQGDPLRYDVARLLLGRGADPTRLDDERGGPLQVAMLSMDTRMLELLLDHGADPNAESGFQSDETLYDWAMFDYLYKIFAHKFPEEPTDEEQSSEDDWLEFLQRIAGKYDRREPDHLFLLRRRGARRAYELAK